MKIELVKQTFSWVYHLYVLTVWSRVIPEKLVDSIYSRNFQHFMEPEGSLLHSQVTTTCPYPEPH